MTHPSQQPPLDPGDGRKPWSLNPRGDAYSLGVNVDPPDMYRAVLAAMDDGLALEIGIRSHARTEDVAELPHVLSFVNSTVVNTTAGHVQFRAWVSFDKFPFSVRVEFAGYPSMTITYPPEQHETVGSAVRVAGSGPS